MKNKGATLLLAIIITIFVFSHFIVTSEENSEDVASVLIENQGDDSENIEVTQIQDTTINEVIEIEEIIEESNEDIIIEKDDEVYIDILNLQNEKSETNSLDEINSVSSQGVEENSVYVPIEEVSEESNLESINDFNVSINQTKIQNLLQEDISINDSENVSGIDSSSTFPVQEFSSSNSNDDENNFEFFSIENISETQDEKNESDLINYTLYKNVDGNLQKEIQTTTQVDSYISIQKYEEISGNSELWLKEVNVKSSEHHNNPVIVYSDILESQNDPEIYWIEESRYIDYKKYDENDNGLTDRISWIVPHLSEQNYQISINLSLTFYIELFNESLNESLLNLSDINNTVNFSIFQTVQNKSIEITTISSPQGIYLSNSILNFNFNISSTNVNSTDLQCDLAISNNTDLIFHIILDNVYKINSSNLDNSNYYWNLFCKSLLDASINNSRAGNFTIEMYIPPVINFISNKEVINMGDIVSFTVNITSAKNPPRLYILNFGDGSINITNFDSSSHYQIINHNYSSTGKFNISLTGNVYNETLSYNKQIIVLSVNKSDTEKPSLSLITPTNDQIIRLNSTSEKIIFTYEVRDNVNVSNCTLSIYHYNNSIIGNLVYYSKKENLGNYSNISTELYDFDDGEYSYDVECYDSSNNEAGKTRDFEISYKDEINVTLKTSEKISTLSSSNEDVERVDNLINQINDFIIQEEKYDKKEKEVVEDLDLLEDLKAFKKKLLQIKLDLDHNLDNFRDETQRQERLDEINADIEMMEDTIPTDIEVVDEKDFTKNNIDFDGIEVSKSYLEFYKITASDGKIKDMTKNLNKIQSKVSVSVNAKKVNLIYNTTEKDILIIKKTISSSNDSYDSFIEVIPKSLADDAKDITFINDINILKSDPILEVKSENIKDRKIIYFIEGDKNLAEVENTHTIGFSEDLLTQKDSNLLTGYAIFGGFDGKSIGFYISWILLVIIIIVFIIYSILKLRETKFKKKPEIKKIIEGLKETLRALEINDLQKAVADFDRIKQDYKLLNPESQKFVSKKIKKLEIILNKKLLSSLIREFISNIEARNKNDAVNIYAKIQTLYLTMPKKIKKKVYSKILPYVEKLKYMQ